MMSKIDIHGRALGLTFTAEGTAQAVIWAPGAKKVAISVNDAPVQIPLTKSETGYWLAETDQIKPGDRYKFILNDEIECTDPAALSLPQGVYGYSQAFDTGAFYWEDSCWVNPPLDEANVYELDICTFTPDGTLKAIATKLGHLKQLGINTVLIRPVIPFPAAPSRHRDGAFLYAVQTCYGGPHQLQQLVNACHYEGIAVMLDLVYKHPAQRLDNLSGLRGHIRKQTARQQQALKADEAQREAWHRYLLENALMWFRDFHVDALRLDGLQALPDAEKLLREIRQHTDALTAVTGRQYYLLVEQETPQSGTARQKLHGKLDRSSKALSQLIRHYQEEYVYDRRFASVLKNLFNRISRTDCRYYSVNADQSTQAPTL